MKKIYLFSMMVLGFVATSVGQTCPPSLAAVAWSFEFQDDDPAHCMIIFESNINEPGWQAALIRDDGSGLPLQLWNNSEPWLNVNSQTGSVSFIYDCYDPNFPGVAYVSLKKVVNGQDPITCQVVPFEPAPTPVKLTSFTGRLQNDNAVVLDWSSSIEWDSYKYEIERSVDGLHFTKVGELNAAGNSTATVKYTFNDQLPTAGAYFYRLKQIDFNGTFEHSKVVYVNSKKGAGAVTKVFPNPTKGEIQLIGATSADLQPNNLSIFSISGQRIKYQVIGNAISMDPAAPDGVYIIRLQSAAGLQQFKVVKNQSAKTY